MLNLSRLKGSTIAEAIQRKQDRTALLAASSKLNKLASPNQQKIFEIMAEGVTLMGRNTNNYPDAEPETQAEFLNRTRRILELNPRQYSPQQARQALTAMKPFWAYIEGTWTPTKNFKTNAQAMTLHINALGGTSAGDDAALQELKDAMK